MGSKINKKQQSKSTKQQPKKYFSLDDQQIIQLWENTWYQSKDREITIGKIGCGKKNNEKYWLFFQNYRSQWQQVEGGKQVNFQYEAMSGGYGRFKKFKYHAKTPVCGKENLLCNLCWENLPNKVKNFYMQNK